MSVLSIGNNISWYILLMVYQNSTICIPEHMKDMWLWSPYLVCVVIYHILKDKNDFQDYHSSTLYIIIFLFDNHKAYHPYSLSIFNSIVYRYLSIHIIPILSILISPVYRYLSILIIPILHILMSPVYRYLSIYIIPIVSLLISPVYRYSTIYLALVYPYLSSPSYRYSSIHIRPNKNHITKRILIYREMNHQVWNVFN